MADYYEEGGYDYLFKIILLGDVDSRKMDFLCTYTGKNRDRTLGKSHVDSLHRHRASLGLSGKCGWMRLFALWYLLPHS